MKLFVKRKKKVHAVGFREERYVQYVCFARYYSDTHFEIDVKWVKCTAGVWFPFAFVRRVSSVIASAVWIGYAIMIQ